MSVRLLQKCNHLFSVRCPLRNMLRILDMLVMPEQFLSVWIGMCLQLLCRYVGY